MKRRAQVNWEGDVPPGLLFHATAITADGLRSTELWAAAEDFQAFMHDRFLPGAHNLGLQGAPRIELYSAHAVFAPMAERQLPPPILTRRARRRPAPLDPGC